MAVTILAHALAAGGAVTWDDPERPKLRVGPEWAARLRDHSATVRDVLGRAVAFRRQLAESAGAAGIPLLTLPGDHEGGCWSCGARCDRWRCLACLVAVYVALDALDTLRVVIGVIAPAVAEGAA